MAPENTRHANTGSAKNLPSRLTLAITTYLDSGQCVATHCSTCGAVVDHRVLCPAGSISADVFVSNKGKVRFKGTYGTLLTGRLILQPRFVTEIEFQRDSEFGVVQGINNVETVLRLVYKVRRELVPYFAVTFRQSSMPRLNASNAKGCVPSALEFVIGLRAWH